VPPFEVIVAIVVGFAVVGVLLLILGKAGWVELHGPLGFFARRHVVDPSDPLIPLRAAKLDLEQYGEVTGALESLVRAGQDEVEKVARDWFTMLATRLATRLKEEKDQHYRVAIWLDDPNYPDYFIGIGHGLFDQNDRDMGTLERAPFTIGGIAFESANMTYYCRDRRTDPNFKPRKSIPPSFESVFGLALGTPTDRWGVMTVDARKVNGFPDDTQWLIRRFGELSSLGAIVWATRAATVPGPPGSTIETSERL
jgi:hypothetical protein